MALESVAYCEKAMKSKYNGLARLPIGTCSGSTRNLYGSNSDCRSLKNRICTPRGNVCFRNRQSNADPLDCTRATPSAPIYALLPPNTTTMHCGAGALHGGGAGRHQRHALPPSAMNPGGSHMDSRRRPGAAVTTRRPTVGVSTAPPPRGGGRPTHQHAQALTTPGVYGSSLLLWAGGGRRIVQCSVACPVCNACAASQEVLQYDVPLHAEAEDGPALVRGVNVP